MNANRFRRKQVKLMESLNQPNYFGYHINLYTNGSSNHASRSNEGDEVLTANASSEDGETVQAITAILPVERKRLKGKRIDNKRPSEPATTEAKEGSKAGRGKKPRVSKPRGNAVR